MSTIADQELQRATELLRAIEPGTHVIEASAGTGKTFTITSLIAAALALDAVQPSRVLTVTFTRAATAELRVRVRERIASLAEAIADPNTSDAIARAVLHAVGGDDAALVVGDRLKRALAEADSIGVDTMHGWCATLLGQYGDLLGLDAPADDTSAALPPVAELTERGALVASARVPMAQWYGFTRRTVSVGGLEQLAGAALAGIARVLVEREDGSVLGDEPADVARLERDITRIAELHSQLSAEWAAHREQHVQSIERAIAGKQLSGKYWRVVWLPKRLDTLDHLLSDLLCLFEANADQCVDLERFTSLKLADTSKSPDAPFTLGEFSDTLEQLFALLPSLTDALAMPIRHFIESVQNSLPQKAADFDDLLRLVAEGLARDPAVAERVRRSADLVLIDESQDTDPLQWGIFLSLFNHAASRKRLVLVGDPKQSIYRFRNAEVAVYLAARDKASGEPFTLDTNYRSDASLVQAVNAIYDGAPGVFGDGVQYEAVVPARSHAELIPVSPAPLRFVEVVPDETRSGVHAVREAVASDVAARIAGVLHPEANGTQRLVRNDAAPRPITARDCAVLVATNRQARQIVRALRAAGVHAVAATRNAVTQSNTAADVYTVLRALDAPDDRALLRAAALTALVRPALGLALTDPPVVILEALDGEAGQRLDEALRGARLRWNLRGIMDAWITLDQELDLSLHIADAADAERRLTDVRHLLELLAAHESRTRAAPAEALRWLAERMQERSTDQLTADELEERLESDDDAVRVLTMHASKGLEFPLVWIPYAWVRPQSRPPTRDRPLVRRYSADQAAVEGVVPIGSGKPSAHPVAQREQAAQALEQQRLLYVALTRARNSCTVYVHEDNAHREASLTRLLTVGGTGPLACVAQLAAVSSNGIALERMHGAGGARASAVRTGQQSTPESIQPASWTRREPLDTWWRRGSFTSLTTLRQATIVSENADRDIVLLEGFREPAADEGDDGEPRRITPVRSDDATLRSARIALADFPRGRAAGNAMHDVLERVVQQGAIPGAIASVIPDALTRQGLGSDAWSTSLAASLEPALDVPFVGLDTPAPTLRTLAAHTTFTELTFDFALVSERGRAIRARQLARAFALHPGGSVPDEYAAELAALDFTPLRGLLTGAIDLVARHNNAWIVLDYKSNHLGDTIGDYALAPMTAAMREHHYILQYHLYLVALHRFLRLRQPSYNYDEHVLGIGYLFVRGMHATHPGSGVFTDRPPRARIEALDALLRTGEIE